jgi:hypothetical protein
MSLIAPLWKKFRVSWSSLVWTVSRVAVKLVWTVEVLVLLAQVVQTEY